MDSIKCDLELEQPLEELAEQIYTMREEGAYLENPGRIQEAMEEFHTRMQEIYANLTTWQTVQVARHKDRPRAIDYINLICDDFLELHGDRAFDSLDAVGLATACMDFGVDDPGSHCVDADSFGGDLLRETDRDCVDGSLACGIVDVFMR